MKFGFTYKGIHSSEYGITVKTDDRPIYPEVKIRSYEPLLADGSYDFTTSNIYEREFYKNRTFSLVMQIGAANLTELNRKIAKIARWLCGAGDLIFDDVPTVKWTARCNSGVKYAPERYGRSAILTVAFEVPPFGSLKWKTCNGPTLADEIRLDCDIPIDIASFYIIRPTFVQDGTTLEITADFSIINIGDRPMRPIITIEFNGAGGRIKPPYICRGNDSIGANIDTNRTTNEATFVFDFEKQKITWDGERCKADGEFFEINSGDTMTLKMKTTAAASVLEEYWNKMLITIDANPKTVWDFDFDNIDWGTDNA